MNLKKIHYATLLALCLTASAPGQTYNGHPFTEVIRQADPKINGTNKFGSIQITGDKVDFAASSTSGNFGVFRTDGGAAEALLTEATILGTGTADSALEGLFQRVEGAADAPITVEAEVGGVSGYYRNDSGVWQKVMSADENMPGKAFTYSLLGEPHAGNGKVAFIGISNPNSFRGVYIRDNATGAFTTVADSDTILPGIGSFDFSSSQVGFDGNNVIFWGIHQLTPTTTSSGIFVGNGGALIALAKTGDPIPGTSATINGFYSPPAISDGKAAFVADDSSFNKYVFYWDGSTTTLIAKDGDTLPGGGVISNLASYPVQTDAGKVVFDAKVDGVAAILEFDGTTLSEILRATDILSFVVPTLFIPADLEGDLLAVYATQGFNEWIYMNQAVPAKPRIDPPTPSSLLIEPGASVTLAPTISGKAPLTTTWMTSAALASPVTTPTLTLENFSAAEAGTYQLRVENDFGSAIYNVSLILNSAPYFISQPADVTGFETDFARLSFSIGGNPSHTYEWFKGDDTTPISTQGFLTFNPVKPEDAGTYRLVVTNALGSVESRVVTFTVAPLPENPSFGGAQFNDLVNDPANFTVGFDGLQTMTIDPSSGNIFFYQFTDGSQKLLAVDPTGKATTYLDPAIINTSLGLTGLFHRFGGVRPDGTVVMISSGFSPNKTWFHSYDGETLTQLLEFEEAVPALNGLAVNFGIYLGGNVFRVSNADASASRFFTIGDEGAELLFSFDGALTDGVVTSTGSLGQFKYASSGEFFASVVEYTTASQTDFSRVWLLKRDGTAIVAFSKNVMIAGSTVSLSSPFIQGMAADGRLVFSSSNVAYQWESGTVARLVVPEPNPGDTFSGLPTVNGGQLFMRGSVASQSGLYRITKDTAELIHGTGYHDKARINSGPTVYAVSGDEIVLNAFVRGQPEQVFVNRGAGQISRLPDIEYTYDPVAKTLTITIPDGQTLWTSENLVDWTQIESPSPYVSPVGTGKEFFQLRE